MKQSTKVWERLQKDGVNEEYSKKVKLNKLRDRYLESEVSCGNGDEIKSS